MRYRSRTFFTLAVGIASAAMTLGACGTATSVRTAAPSTSATQAPVPSPVTTPSGAPTSGVDRPGPSVAPPSQASVPSAVTPPPSAAPIPSLDRTVPSVAKPTNRNAKNTPTSRLCWAQRETFLLLINSMMSADAKGVATATLLPTLDSVDFEIAGIQQGKLDPLLAPFVERFANDLKAARKVWTAQPLIASQDLVNSFDFENYPAVKEFADAAKRDPGCVDIT
jgi:hypothetical protein